MRVSPHLRIRGKQWLVVAGAALAVTTLAELVLRACCPMHTADAVALYVYDAELGYRLKPALHWTDTTDHRRELITNARGTVNRQASFDAYPQLVFAIGDSYTQGTGVAFDEAYPAQLDRLLNVVAGRYRPAYGVVNLGLAAYGTRQATLTAQRFAKSIGRPQTVLYLAAPNDVSDDRLFASGYRHRHRVAGNPHHWMPAGLIHAVTRTQIGRRVKHLAARTRRQQILDAAAPAMPWIESQSGHLEGLRSAVDAMGARLVISYVGLDEDYDALRDWCTSRGIGFADWRPGVLAAMSADSGLHTHNQHSGGHFQPWVYAAIADAFAKEILATDERQSDPAADAEAQVGTLR